MPRRRKRLDPTLFPLPVERLREGIYSDDATNHARAVARALEPPPRVVMTFSASAAGTLGGIDEAVALLRICAEEWNELVVHAMYEGDQLEPAEPVLSVEGAYHAFAHLETPILGVLERRSAVATHVRAVVEAARPKAVFYLPARGDHWEVQAGDGYAAHLAGAACVTTPAQASLAGAVRYATVTHALIAACGGNTVLAAQRLAQHVGKRVPLIALVDHENDCVNTSLEVARALDERLWGVRLDTSPFLVDRSIMPRMGSFIPNGVPAQLVWAVREALDGEGFGDVKIALSSGVSLERIRRLEEDGVPIDAYGLTGSPPVDRGAFSAHVVQVVRADGEARPKGARDGAGQGRLERVR
jgi:nicotinate phosphoribosyltransferase